VILLASPEEMGPVDKPLDSIAIVLILVHPAPTQIVNSQRRIEVFAMVLGAELKPLF
jgi:hypothetical protein